MAANTTGPAAPSQRTYGFGGSEPTRDVNAGDYSPAEPAGGVKTSSGEDAVYILTEQFPGKMAGDQSYAGVSPVNGLMPGSDVCDSDWERQITGSEISYVGNNAAEARSGAANHLGSWPIDPARFGNGAFAGRTLGDRPSDGSWNQSATPGSEASSWKGGPPQSGQGDSGY